MSKKEYYDNNAAAFINSSLKYDLGSFYETAESIFETFQVKNIADLAFGSGRDMIYFNSIGFNTIGFDNCDKFLENAKHQGLNVYKTTFPSFECSEPLDGMYSIGLIEHLTESERTELFVNIYKNLRKEGVFLISFNTMDRENDPEREFYKIDKETFLSSMEKAGFILNSLTENKDIRGFEWIVASFVKES